MSTGGGDYEEIHYKKWSKKNIVERKSLRPTQILLSCNIDYSLKEYKKQKYKLFFFCWDTMTVGLYFFFYSSKIEKKIVAPSSITHNSALFHYAILLQN
jgi:hypothetical protein